MIILLFFLVLVLPGSGKWKVETFKIYFVKCESER
jgi:hypothetical protein